MAVTNDWGKGVDNNTNGWGKAADNATNGFGSVYASSAAGDTLLESGGAGVAPVISGVPTISSENEVGETITATPASVTGTPTPTTTWQWQRSSDGVTGWADISGATSSTYTLVVADNTKYVRVVQTATNASGSDSANSAASSQIVGFAFSNALSFDGVNDSLTMSTAVSKPALTSGFSASMWIKFNATPNFEYVLGYSGSTNMWFRFNSATSIVFRSRSAGAATTSWTVSAISTGTWYHIAISLVNTVNELWINGTKYTGDTDDYDNEYLDFDQIGLGSGAYAQCVIDELALQAGSGLSQANVDALYNSGSGAFATDVMTPDVYYRLNESEPSATAADSSGNGNTGTVTGATFVAH